MSKTKYANSPTITTECGTYVIENGWISKEHFDKKLKELLENQPASYLLEMNGVYEVVAKLFKYIVLKELKAVDVMSETLSDKYKTIMEEHRRDIKEEF